MSTSASPRLFPFHSSTPKTSGQRKGYQSVRLTDGKDLRMGGRIVQPALYIYPVLSFPIILAEQPIRERDVQPGLPQHVSKNAVNRTTAKVHTTHQMFMYKKQKNLLPLLRKCVQVQTLNAWCLKILLSPKTTPHEHTYESL